MNIQDAKEVLVSLEYSLGADHPDTIRARHKLAHAYRAVQRFEEAISLFAENAGLCDRVFGAAHLITLRRRSSLANCYYAAGRFNALPTTMISGCTPSHSQQNILPVRPNPVCISSAMRSTSFALQTAHIAARYPAGGTMTPPSP